jgi:hypothetical protein
MADVIQARSGDRSCYRSENPARILIDGPAMNFSQERHSKSPEFVVTLVPGRHRFRFHTRHLLALMACVAIAITALNVAIKNFSYTSTTVEIIKYHPTWEPTGSVEFLVLLPNGGFLQSAVSVPANTSSIDYSKLVGAKVPMRYRAQRVLWLAPENPTIVAYLLIQTKVDQFVSDERAE